MENVGKATKQFLTYYLVTIFILLWITDIITQVSDISMTGLTVLRSILLFFGIIFSAGWYTRKVIRKYGITRDGAVQLNFNLKMIIIVIALISIVYFIINLNNNINEYEDSTTYQLYSRIIGNDDMDSMLEKVKADATKSYFIIWGVILCGSFVAVLRERSVIAINCN